MILTTANEVFDKTSFQEDTDYLEYPKITFFCPTGYGITFSMRHFKKHALSKTTNLTVEDAKEIDNFIAGKDLGGSNSFLDFYCPESGDAVRVYYTAWAGGRFTSGYDINYIVRKPKEKETPY